MMNSYRTDRPNEAHQLMVAPSKHYYLGRDGLLKYQDKPFAVTLADVPQATRQHMVTYALRDHCSTLLFMALPEWGVLGPVRMAKQQRAA
jgi:hypothetical protein